MKTIVVTTDFSPNANRAAHFAMQLAHAHKASLILVNTFHFWPSNPPEVGMNFPLSSQIMYEDSQKSLKHLANQLQERYGTGVPIRCITKEGFAMPSIREVSQAEKADVLIMSTVGSAPQSAQLMGSMATEMVAETTVPLLLIPPSVDYTTMTNVVLGIDLDTPPDAIVLDKALQFIQQLDCVVDIVCIHDNPTEETVRQKAEHIRRLLADIPHTLTIKSGKDIYQTLLAFVHSNKADLLVMLPKAHTWFTHLFKEGETERMARLTDIPLLAVV